MQFITTFCNRPFTMQGKLYLKLRASYELKTNEKWKDDKTMTEDLKERHRKLRHDRMHSRMLAVFLRYETLIATQKAAGMQGSVPLGAFHVLRDQLGVNGECFASPLNQTLVRVTSNSTVERLKKNYC